MDPAGELVDLHEARRFAWRCLSAGEPEWGQQLLQLGLPAKVVRCGLAVLEGGDAPSWFVRLAQVDAAAARARFEQLTLPGFDGNDPREPP